MTPTIVVVVVAIEQHLLYIIIYIIKSWSRIMQKKKMMIRHVENDSIRMNMISTSHWIPFNYGTPSTLDEWIEKGWSNQPFNDEAIAAAAAAYPIIVLDEPKKKNKNNGKWWNTFEFKHFSTRYDCLQFAKRI